MSRAWLSLLELLLATVKTRYNDTRHNDILDLTIRFFGPKRFLAVILTLGITIPRYIVRKEGQKRYRYSEF